MEVYLKLMLWVLLQRLKMPDKIGNFEIVVKENCSQLCKQYRDGHLLAIFCYCCSGFLKKKKKKEGKKKTQHDSNSS